jgi:hypothetical protein
MSTEYRIGPEFYQYKDGWSLLGDTFRRDGTLN